MEIGQISRSSLEKSLNSALFRYRYVIFIRNDFRIPEQSCVYKTRQRFVQLYFYSDLSGCHILYLRTSFPLNFNSFRQTKSLFIYSVLTRFLIFPSRLHFSFCFSQFPSNQKFVYFNSFKTRIRTSKSDFYSRHTVSIGFRNS